MKKFLSVVLSLFIAIGVFLYFPVNAFADSSSTAVNTDEQLYNDIDDIGSIMKYINDNYAGDVTYDQMKEAALKGIFSILDKYSEYFSKDEFSDFTKSTSGVFSGVGLVLTEKDGKIVVTSTIEGSPAENAGIKSGYVIVSVDGKDVSGMNINDVVNKIVGDAGTKVKITFDTGGTIKEYELTREIIHLNPVTYKIINGIGYIKIAEFNENTTDNVEKALKYMDDNGIKKIILDLRDNPGGLLTEAVGVANFFVPEGVVLTVDEKGDKDEVYYSNLKSPKYKLAVLINGGSASASEILAGAIQDTKAGILIGEKSFGKGTVQTVLPLPDGSGIKLTIAKYKLPSGRYIDGVGLTPDIEVKNTSIDLPQFKFNNELKVGSTGDNVRLLQQYLNALGFDCGKIDGIFGPKTKKAVKQLQAKLSLKSTGVFDKVTYESMIEMYNNVNSVDNQLNKALEKLKNL